MISEPTATTTGQINGNSSSTATTAARPIRVLFKRAKRQPATPIRTTPFGPQQRLPLAVTNVELFGTESITPLANDLFLRCAMEATTLPSVQLEMLLGYARAELLRLTGERGEDNGEIDDDIVAFACALARQCFINEYIYGQAEAESGLGALARRVLSMDEAGPAEMTPRRRRYHTRSLSGSEKKVGAARQSQGGSEQARK